MLTDYQLQMTKWHFFLVSHYKTHSFPSFINHRPTHTRTHTCNFSMKFQPFYNGHFFTFFSIFLKWILSCLLENFKNNIRNLWQYKSRNILENFFTFSRGFEAFRVNPHADFVYILLLFHIAFNMNSYNKSL